MFVRINTDQLNAEKKEKKDLFDDQKVTNKKVIFRKTTWIMFFSLSLQYSDRRFKQRHRSQLVEMMIGNMDLVDSDHTHTRARMHTYTNKHYF